MSLEKIQTILSGIAFSAFFLGGSVDNPAGMWPFGIVIALCVLGIAIIERRKE